MCIELNQFEEANGLLDALIDEYQHEVEFEDNHMRFSEAEKLPEDGDDEEEDENEGGGIGAGGIGGAGDAARDHRQGSSEGDNDVLRFDEGVEELSEGLPPRVVILVLKLWRDLGSAEGNGVAEHQSENESVLEGLPLTIYTIRGCLVNDGCG